MLNKPTVVIGASSNPSRYSYMATTSLEKHGHTVFPVGIKTGKINSTDIITDKPILPDIDTVTLYIGPDKQAEWANYIFSLKPKRIIFNPGTENPEFELLAQQQGIETLEACTLVLLSINKY